MLNFISFTHCGLVILVNIGQGNGFLHSPWNRFSWMPLNLTDDKSTLVQVMAWCCQATCHYLSQCWHRSMSIWIYCTPQSYIIIHLALFVFAWRWNIFRCGVSQAPDAGRLFVGVDGKQYPAKVNIPSLETQTMKGLTHWILGDVVVI